MDRLARCVALFLVRLSLGVVLFTPASASPPDSTAAAAQIDRSPVDLLLTPDEKWLLTANQTSGSVSLVRVADGVVVDEILCGGRPSALALTPDGNRVLVSCTASGELHVLSLEQEKLKSVGVLRLDDEPLGLAVTPDGHRAYVALTKANEVAVVDLDALAVQSRIPVGRWPRYLALSPDGTRLAVGTSGNGGVSVVDADAGKPLYDTKFLGLNLGHMQTSADGKFVYVPWMVYADRPITTGNIREGWVLGNRLARVRLDGPAPREALALDPRGKAMGDPHGLALSPDEQWLAMSVSGTHELVVFRMSDLPLRPDGPGDHMPSDLSRDDARLLRIPLGGRPMAVRFDRAGQNVFVANYLANSVQVVNLAERRIARTIPLGSAPQPSLARRGEEIFYDAQRSVDGWYSCHSCHYDGGSNAVTMDTKNDGSFGTYKMVLSLHNLRHTGPWFWHGWQTDMHSALKKSLADTMQGPAPTDDDALAVAAFLDTLETAPPAGESSGRELSVQAAHGKQVFHSEAAACGNCHGGPYFTDGQIHDVGLGSSYDAYDGYNTPSLIDVGNRAGYLHHGRAKSLDELLSDLHSPAKVSGTRELTDQERADLVEYLKTL